MKNYFVLLLMLLSGYAKGQETYTPMRNRALAQLRASKTEADERVALGIYEAAFKAFPDSVDESGLYKASVLASSIKEYDKAFDYLTRYIKLTEEDPESWKLVAGNYSKSEYKNLLNDARWKVLEGEASQRKSDFFSKLQQDEQEFLAVNKLKSDSLASWQELYKQFKTKNPYQAKPKQDYSVTFNVNDSTETSYFVHLPKAYDPQKKYALLFFLHGAVRGNALTPYQLASWNLGAWNRFYTKYAELENVILVFPKGSREYNWMTSDKGFFMVPTMLKQIKKSIHVDDNKVFITGHSNGATGSFSYLMKQPSPFAGFYGFNTNPKVFTGGTFIENIRNRSFINFSTDEDYYYPPNANDSLDSLMKVLKADYQDHRYNGYPHWFPAFDESEKGVKILFDDLKRKTRNPFPSQLEWEFDDENYGSVDWITDLKLDTTLQVKAWHQNRNFKITKWLEYDKQDSLQTLVVDKKAFDFPRKSGKVIANYKANTFKIMASRVKSLVINVSPEMIDMDKAVKVYVNGKLYFNHKVSGDPAFIKRHFLANQDKDQLWVNHIEIKL